MLSSFFMKTHFLLLKWEKVVQSYYKIKRRAKFLLILQRKKEGLFRKERSLWKKEPLWPIWVQYKTGQKKRQDKIFKYMEHLPNDPMMLFSAVNMLLRDEYSSLDALCDDMNVNRKDIENKLVAAGFEYNEKQNKFW